MNAPYADFLRGALPGEPPLSFIESYTAYSGSIIVFEADRRFEPHADLSQRILKWKRKRNIGANEGHVHTIAFPDAPMIDMLAWTSFRAFHFRVPNDRQRPPIHRVFFPNSQALVQWKRQHLLPDQPFMVHATLFHSSGERLLTSRLLTF